MPPCREDAPRPTRRRFGVLVALAAVFAVSGATAWAATYTYLNGNLYNSKASGAWTNHREHWIDQHGGLSDRRVQTGHQNSSGAHVAIVRAWGNAAWGPSGPAGYYGQPKCWRIEGPSPVGVGCKRKTP